MKQLFILSTAIFLFSSCHKKSDGFEQGKLEFPENWGMLAYVGEGGFSASSLNASLIYDTTAKTFELNVNGWQKQTDETIYLSYKNFSFEPHNYLVFQSDELPQGLSYAFYEKDHMGPQFSTGGISIHSTADTLIKGAFNFTTRDNKCINGVFTIKPHFVVE